jgi:hypothetical protein
MVADPVEYGVQPGEDIEARARITATRMGAALDAGTAGVTNSPAFGRMARKLGIPYTAGAIYAAHRAITLGG